MSVDVNLDSTLNFAAAQISTSSNINYIGWIDAVENVTVTAAHATLPRKDRLVAYIDLALITSATTNNLNALKFLVVAGTAASSPVVPTSGAIQTAVGASNPYIVLADVNVAAATTTIVTANITDARTPAALNMPYLWGGALNILGHLVPNFADDTVALLNAIQTIKGKSMSLTGNAATGIILTNPYKFSVYRAAAQNSTGGAFARVNFDTKEFDTGNNYDATTNYRFVVPVNGFYSFNWAVRAAITSSNTVASLYKNGVEFKRGVELAATGLGESTGSAFVQATAGDYFEIFVFASNTAGLGLGAVTTYFQGKLDSHL